MINFLTHNVQLCMIQDTIYLDRKRFGEEIQQKVPNKKNNCEREMLYDGLKLLYIVVLIHAQWHIRCTFITRGLSVLRLSATDQPNGFSIM